MSVNPVETKRPLLVLGVTSATSSDFFRGQPRYLERAGFDVLVLSSPGKQLDSLAREGVATAAVPMRREISLAHDCVSLLRLWRLLKELRPAIVEFGTPKAGLLGTVAAWLAHVPCRIYTIHGLRLETTRGPKRSLLMCTERLSGFLATRVLCVSESLRERVVELGIARRAKTIVLGNGSRIGVDVERFSPQFRGSAELETLRHRLGLPLGAPVIGFVGRFVKDKGIRELVKAFQQLRATYPHLRLLLVGDFEQGDPVEPEIRRFIESSPAMIRPGFVPDTAPYYGLMDVLALPTYREGFPGVLLEAQASGVPVVTTTATGAVDSVVDGETGFLVPVGDSSALAGAIAKLLEDPQLRLRMGRAGRARMERDFRQEAIWSAQVKMYRRLLEKNTTLRDRPPAKSTTERTTGRVAKRAFDLVAAIAALLVFTPILLMVAALVKMFLGSPILFRQSRPGWQGKPFTCLKFRTMTQARDAEQRLLPDAERMTAFGTFLRRSSIDELPELINVIRGEMSLVGPRPLLPQYLERYTPEQMRRHAMKPGITGWAQVNGRNTLDWKRKFELDVWYVDHHSLWLDMLILARTLGELVRPNGISRSGHATMPEFFGVGAESDHGGTR